MTVKELEEFLENLPDDAQCFVAESYCSHTSQNYWETWQAARASLIVTPPRECFYEKADVQDFIDHMERLGLTVVLPSK